MTVSDGEAARRGAADQPSLGLFIALLAAITIIRLIGQHFSAVDIDVDEAQYWVWSRELAFGYFSKPPLIAWFNAASGLVCGDSIECIRAPVPILYFGTSLIVYAIARELYDRRTAFWAGLVAAITPGVAFSARVMTTDVLLLFFWAAALLGYVKLLRRPTFGWYVLLAVALGLGLLAKYAMAYFVPGVVLAAVFSPEGRALAKRPGLWIALAAGILMLAPNVIWNMQNGFATAHATAAYVDRGNDHTNFGAAIGFLAAQLGVAGPITFGTLLVLFARFGARSVTALDRMLIAFSVTPLVVVTATGFYSGAANANWAAPAMISAFVVTSAVLVRGRWWKALKISIGFGILMQVLLLISDPFADTVTIPPLGRNADIFRNTMGWEAAADKVRALADDNHAAAIAAEGRGDVSTEIYYLRDDPRPIFNWTTNPQPTNHFEQTRWLTASAPEPVLFVTGCADAERLKAGFGQVADLGTFEAATGISSARHYHAFLLSAAKNDIPPLAPCPVDDDD